MKNALISHNGHSKTGPVGICLVLACLLTNISQHPELVEAGATQFLAIPVWGLLALVLLLSRSFSVHRDVLLVLGCILVFSVLIALYTILFGYPYFASGTAYSAYLCVFVFLVGALCARHVKNRALFGAALAYVLSALVVAVLIYIRFFVGNEEIFSRLYVYTSKNSFAQIALVAIILLFTVIQPKKRGLLLLKYAAAAFLIYLLFILRSRATIVSFAVALLLILFLQRRFQPSAKDWRVLLVALAVFVAFLIFHAEFRSLLVNDILLGARESEDLDAISSGRLSALGEYLPILKENILVGIGNFYFDCFPVATLIQFGLFASIPLFIIALYPLFRACRPSAYGEDWRFALLLFAVAYAVNSIFECLPPFGPGVKCYFLWLLLGLTVGAGRPQGGAHGK